MRKGRLDRQAGSKGRGLDLGIEEFRPLSAEGDKGSSVRHHEINIWGD